jgi:hypothetical protein
VKKALFDIGDDSSYGIEHDKKLDKKPIEHDSPIFLFKRLKIIKPLPIAQN